MTNTEVPPCASSPADIERRLRLLSMAAFVSLASMRWCDALLPVLSAEFSSTPGQVSQVIWAFAVAYGVMQLVYGPLGDRHGKYTVVSWAALACTVGAFASALAPGLGWLTLARVLNGATAAGVIPLTMAWIGDNVPWERRQQVLARFLGAVVLGLITGQLLSGLFADVFGWRTGFLVLALLFMIVGVAMRRGMHGASPQRGASAAAGMSSLQRMRHVWHSPHARGILAITAIEGGFNFSAVAFAPSHLHGRFGIAVSSAGAILALYGLGGLAYSQAAGWLLARMPALAMARAGGLVAGGAWVILALAPGWAWSLPLCLLAGAGFNMMHNTLQTLATQMAPAQRGTAMSLFACVLFLGQSAGMGAAAWVVDHLSTAATLAGCGVGLASVGLIVGGMATPGGEADREG